MSKKIDVSYKKLYSWYITEIRSASWIAKYYNCSNVTILNWLRRYDIPVDSKRKMTGIKPWLFGENSVTKRYDVKLKMRVNHADFTGKNNPNYGKGSFGKDNPNWKGGITSENKRIRQSNEYSTWRLAVYKRDRYTCQVCGHMSTRLVAHHKQEFSKYPEVRFDIDNGITLCTSCHFKEHYKSKSGIYARLIK